MGEGDTLLNALLGGAVTILATVVLGPASPVAGGGVAGYLQGGTSKDGAIVGAISGLIAFVPFLLFFLLFAVVGVAPFVGLAGSVPILASPELGEAVPFVAIGGGVFLLVALFFLFAFFVGALSFAGLGALGGVLGVYVATETDIGE